MPAAPVPVFDPVQLKRQTKGDPQMQVEVLALFVAEVERLMRQIDEAPDAMTRGERLRALIGVARSTGATLLTQRARALEVEVTKDEVDLAPLREAATQTLDYVRRAGV